ncbi:MAG: hypothetical protein ABI548_09990 [Polyangiaceae bacterium]
MNRPRFKHPSKIKEPKRPSSRFAPAAFLKGEPESVRELCQALADQMVRGFSDLRGTSWRSVATSLVDQLRTSGHDLSQIEDTDEIQAWQATWYHPRGTFSLLLSFRAPAAVEVMWKADDAIFTAKA